MALSTIGRNQLNTGIDDNSDATAITINSSENVLVGGTNVYPADNNIVGHSLTAVGQLQSSVSGYAAFVGNRKSSDGEVAIFKKDGTTVGTIGAVSGRTFVNSQGGALSLRTAGSDRLQIDASYVYPQTDNSYDLGSSGNRFNDLYLGGNLYIGGTGSANALDDYEEGDWTPTGNGQTLTNNFAKYRKIGSLVAIQAYVVFPTNSDTSGNANIAGLPFAGTQPSNAYGALTVGYSDKGSSFTILKGNTTTDMDLRFHDGNNVKNADMSGKTLIFAGVYISV